MDFEFTAEQHLYQETLRKVVSRELEPLLRSYADDRPLPKEAVLQAFGLLAPLGCFGARVARENGGSGLDPVSYGIIMEELLPALALDVLSMEAVAKRIEMGGTPEQRRRYLPGLTAGRQIAATAISEPNVGSDVRGIETRAERQGDHYLITGQKLWICNASISDFLIVVASVGRETGKNMLARFIVERDVSPYEAKDIQTLGLQQSRICEVVFEGCRVPAENLLGEPGDAHRTLTYTWLAQRCAFGLMAVHLGHQALSASIRYARERQQFGKPIGSFQLIQALVAEMATLVDASRLLCYRALALLDRGVECPKESSMAKLYATEMGIKVTSMAIQVHGAFGLTREYGLEKLFRDARMLTMPEGTTQIQQLIVGRELLGLRAFS